MADFPTSSPTAAPTFTNSTASSSSTGETIGIAIIAEIISGAFVGLMVIFQKLICFRIFDSYAGSTGILTDICSCYKESWEKDRRIDSSENQDRQKDAGSDDGSADRIEKGERDHDKLKPSNGDKPDKHCGSYFEIGHYGGSNVQTALPAPLNRADGQLSIELPIFSTSSQESVAHGSNSSLESNIVAEMPGEVRDGLITE